MCMQCMAGAMTAASGATGARSYLATRGWSWVTPKRLRRITMVLLVTALVASAFLVGGSAPAVRAGEPGSASQSRHATPARSAREAPDHRVGVSLLHPEVGRAG
jgi:hypothetical protein